MKFVAVATVQDAGAAEVLKELLTQSGIDVELKRLSPTAYHAVISLTETEVRVPENRLTEAQAIVEQFVEENEKRMTDAPN